MGAYCLVHGEGHADLVQTAKQAMLAKRIDVEVKPLLIRRGDDLVFKVDSDVALARDLHQTVHLVLRQHYRKDSVLEGIARKRSEEHTSELQSLMRISYAVFCLKQTKQTTQQQ